MPAPSGGVLLLVGSPLVVTTGRSHYAWPSRAAAGFISWMFHATGVYWSGLTADVAPRGVVGIPAPARMSPGRRWNTAGRIRGRRCWPCAWIRGQLGPAVHSISYSLLCCRRALQVRCCKCWNPQSASLIAPFTRGAYYRSTAWPGQAAPKPTVSTACGTF